MIDKLVRDKIPDIIRDSGNQYEISTLIDDEYIEALRQKLVEEAKEVATCGADPCGIADNNKLAEELADVMEVIDALMTATGIELETVKEIQKQKRSQRGRFNNRIKLLWTEAE